MKTIKIPVILLSICLLLPCVPDYGQSKNIGKASITGKWKLAEIFQGYHNGGDFKWKKPAGNSYTYQFSKNGSFEQDGVSAACLPATFIQKRSLLIISYSCNKVDTSYIEKLSADTLIIRNKVLEGITKLKFYRIQ
jgi:hypothetical protein